MALFWIRTRNETHGVSVRPTRSSFKCIEKTAARQDKRAGKTRAVKRKKIHVVKNKKKRVYNSPRLRMKIDELKAEFTRFLFFSVPPRRKHNAVFSVFFHLENGFRPGANPLTMGNDFLVLWFLLYTRFKVQFDNQRGRLKNGAKRA